MGLLDLLETKEILGWGLSIGPHSIRMVQSAKEGAKLRVLALEEVKIVSLEPGYLQEVLLTLGIPPKARLAVNLRDESLHWKKASLPSMPERDIPKALHWQLLEDAEHLEQEIEVRYNLLGNGSGYGKKEFMVYGISRAYLEKTQRWYRDLNLNVVVAEPLPVSLAAWLSIIAPANKKIRGILHLRDGQGDFVGVEGSEILYSQSFVYSSATEEQDSNSISLNSDLAIKFQQCIDDFLLKNNLSQVEEAILAGDWDPLNREAISHSLGIPFSNLGESPGPTVIYSNDDQGAKAPQYAAELGLSIYPEAAL